MVKHSCARVGFVVVLVFSLSVVSLSGWGADAWPNCSFRCTAGDVQLTSLYAVVPGGACEPGGMSTAQIYGRFTANAARYAVILLGDLQVQGGMTTRLNVCAGDLSSGTTDVLLATVSWTCGSGISIGNVVISWSTNAETCADASCSSRTSQCAKGQDVVVSTPIVVDFTSNSPRCLGTPVSFTNASTGGTAPFTYSWDFGDGGTSSQASPTHSYSSPGSYTATLTVRDRNGSSDSHSRTVTVSPIPAATAGNSGPYCPGQPIQLIASGGTSYSWTGPNGFTSSSQNPTISSASATKAGTYTVTVANSAGCTAQASTTVIVDSTSPLVTAPGSARVECGGPTSPAATGQATATDDSDRAPSVSYSDSASLTGCGGTGTITRTWTAVDACGNSTTALQTITVSDTSAPKLMTPADVTIACGQSTSPSATGQATAADACSAPGVTYVDQTSLTSCGGTGAIRRTWTATDACGNKVSGVQTITVVDAIAPAITIPADETVACGQSTLPAATGQATATDACSTPTVTYVDQANLTGCGGTGTIQRTWTATDACGNKASGVQTMTVVDATAPTLMTPADVTVSCSQSTSPAATGQATATDACSTPSVTYVDQTTLSGCGGTGTIRRTWTATDACGNTASSVQTITVADVKAPALVVPADITVSCGQSTLPAATGQASATDACSTPTVTYADQASLSGCAGTGTIRRTWTATDACENVASAMQTITVVDLIAPALTVPPAATRQVGQSMLPSSTGQATATDGCSAATVTYSDRESLGSDGTGTIARAWTATDACGNATAGAQTITVVAAPPPPTLSLTPPADVRIESGQAPDPSLTGHATASTTCSTPATVTYADVANLTGCDGTGTIVRTWTAQDGCGNVKTAVQTIAVADSGHITLTTPPNVTIPAASSTDPMVTGQATATDPDMPGDPPDVSYTDVANLTGCDGTGTILRTWMASDDCGNSATAVQTITVEDTGHLLLTIPADATVEAGGSVDPTVTGQATATDPDMPGDPPDVSYTDVANLAGCDGTGTILRTWMAKDDCGNTVAAVQTITVADSGHIALTVPPDVTVEAGGSVDPTVTGQATATDPDMPGDPPDVSYTDVANLTGCDETGTILRTWIASDDCRNTASAVQTITVVDAQAPVLTVPADVTLDSEDPTDPESTGWASANDPRSPGETLVVTYSDAPDLTGCDGTGAILRTWTATDECGNTATAAQTLTIVDEGHLGLLVPADATVECGHAYSPAVLGWATGSDPDAQDVPPDVTYTDTLERGNCAGTGIVTRTWTVVDGCGHSLSAAQTITLVDTTPPALRVPADETVEYGDPTDPAATGRASAADLCSVTTLSHADVVTPGECAGRATILRTWTAVDECGNAASGVQTITVVDTTPPALTIPSDAVVECGRSTSPTATGVATASDESGTPAISYSDQESGATCGGSRTILRTWTATGACGNTSSAVQTIRVVDSTAPSLTTPPDITLQVGQSVLPVTTGQASAIDSCSSPIVTYSDAPALSPDGTGTIVRTWIAADECGNAAQGVQTLTLSSAPIPPHLSLAIPPDRTVDAGSATDPSALGSAIATSTCGSDIAVTYQDQANLSGCDGTGTILRAWTATDTCGNQATAVQRISVVDVGEIQLMLPPDLTVGCNASLDLSLTGTATAYDPDATDGPPVVSYDDLQNLDPFTGAGTVLRAWTATDSCGNSVSATQTITVSGSCAPRVIISEVAWAGTGASADEQWIELRNLGDDAVDLVGWTLRWRPAKPDTTGDESWKTLSLSGVIGPAAGNMALKFGPNPQDPQTWYVDLSNRRARGDFFLLERVSDDTVLDVRAGLVYDASPDGARTLGLSDRGDVVELLGPGGNVIDTANTSRDGIGGWTAGDAATRGSMERTDPYAGDTAENWHTNLGIITSGEDAGGVGLFATAGLENEPQLAEMVAVAALAAMPIGGGAEVTVPLPEPTDVAAGNARLVALAPGTNSPVSLPLGVTESGRAVTIEASGAMPSSPHPVWIRVGDTALLVLVQGP